MNFVRLIMGALPLALGYFCLATVVVQAGGLAMLWTSGRLTKDKAIRYAAIAYGLDVTELPADDASADPSGESDQDLTQEQLLKKRVEVNAILVARGTAMKMETDAIRGMEKEVKADRDRRATVRKNFRSYLDDLEKQVVIASLADVQRTLESLSARQAKDIILRTLEDEGLDEGDDVMADMVTIMKEMPDGKRKKINSEFKGDEEEEVLHRILMEIGDLASEEAP